MDFNFQKAFTWILPVLLLILSVVSCTDKNQQKDFEEIRSEVRELWASGEYGRAIDLLETNRSRFAEGYEEFIAYDYLGKLHVQKDSFEKGFEYLHAGMDEGYFYSFFPWFLEKIENAPDSDSLLSKNERIRSSAWDTTRVRFEAILPENFQEDQLYPLLLFLHGGNSSLDGIKEEWKNVELEQPHIVVLVQSSSPVSSFAYNWPDSDRSREDIQSVYNQVKNDYSIDESQVIVAGFSAGGRMSVDTILQNTIPAKALSLFVLRNQIILI